MMAPDHWQTFAALIFICLSNLSGVSSRAKLVSVNLNTKWKDTPIVLEASEFLAKESNEYFWSFVDDISQMQIDSINYNDFTHYEIVLDVARSLLTSHQVNLLKFALSIRTYSPAVQMHNEIANDRRPPAHCNLFVEVNNMITCELFALGPFIEQAKNQSKPLIIKSDHQYPSSKASDDVFVILYAQLGTNDFSKWHTKLKELANKGEITYILRHYVKNPLNRKVRLSGYGVELAIKSTEYKAKDDTKVEGDKEKREESENDDEDTQGFFFSKLKKLHPELKSNLAEFKQHLIDSTSDLAPLKVWQLQGINLDFFKSFQVLVQKIFGDLSFQAAQKVLSEPKDNQLMMLKDISQNFPSRARSLVKTPVSDEFRREVKRNQKHLENNYGLLPGDSALFINGRQADLDVYDVFTLLETLRSEGKLMEGLFSLGSQFGLSSQDMLQLLMVDLKDAETNYAVDIRDPSVIYINDLERDRRYSGWPSSIQDLLRPTFPGMLRHISKNLFHMVLFVNPADKQSADLLKLAEAFYVHSAPVRIGLVFVVNKDENVDGNTDAGVALVRGFNYIMKQHGAAKALSFLTDVFESAESKIVTSKTVIDEFSNSFSANMDGVFGPNSDFDGRRLIYDKVGHTVLTPEFVADSLTKQFNKEITHDILEPDSEYDILREESANFFERTGLGELPQVLLNGVPLKKEEMQDEFEEAVVRSILRQTGDLQKAVFNGFLRDGMDMLDYVMTRINVMPRLNSRILSTSEKYLDLSQSMPGSLVSKPIVFKSLDSAKMSSAIASSLKYLVKKEEPSARPVTHWVVCDLDVPQGRAFFYEAVKQLKHTNGVRLGVVHNPSAPGGASAKLKISSAIQVALDTLSPNMAKSFITKLLKEENVEALFNGEKSLEDLAVGNMDFDSFNKNLAEYSDDLVESHQIFCGRVLNFGPGERGVVTNGRLIGPLKDGEFFIEEDFTLLEKYTVSASAGKIEKKVKTNKIEEDQVSDLIMKVEALLMSVPQKEARKEVVFHEAEHSIIRIPPKEEGPAFDLVAILDPTTRAAQKYTPFIMVLQKVANMNITVFLNCREKLSEMPLKSYYRFVLEPELDYSADSKEDSSGPFAGFYDMPEKPLLTLGMDPPESWLVQAVHSPYDLDNIFLEEVESIVAADFELEYLLLEGHCYDVLSGNPPRGLQFVLGTNSTPAVVDTIVMANLGYFQLKAVPGLWFLRLREGRSRELYDIVSQDNTDTPSGSTDVIAVIDSFKSKIIRVKVAKKSGKENEDLLSEDEPSMGLWDSISSKFGGGTKDSEDDADLTLNIFSLASGHLYERFLRIMMLSVLKNTKSKVKFWFLKNYLSPSFKDFIPHMAEKYGFEFELVQYKWPRWLHQQTEKQRIIWGYKILFLDVLFPLSVNKFIFVDADQTVRADLKELHDLDLEGAPYGYTPFCESRKEMDGYRFWKSGYWSNHLGHRKYHISALYVVDLKKFRKIAAGDRLRGQYQGLSQDPNSLSNLDQDLPNNMIHQVGIKSLPQEWLWCETWCSDEEKTRAKTIDLCNNPKTKEPKLQAAQRIVAEWVDYDTEIKRLWDEVNNRNITIDTEPETTTPRTDL